MTLETAISPDVIQAENNTVRGLFGNTDNPNPERGHVEQTPDAPGAEAGSEQEAPKLSAREQIAANAKARRAAAAEDMTQNEMGEYVPPFVKSQEDTAAAEAKSKADEDEAARKAAEAPKTYKLKVNGNEIDVTSRDELLKAAEVDEDEASEYSERALIRLAQKNLAAQSLLDEAKQVKKSARQSVRADEEDTTPDPTDTQDSQDAVTRTRQHQPVATHKDVIEKIQYGDPDEAADALNNFLKRGVNEALTEARIGERVQTVEAMIERATKDFEAANADLTGDPDFADLTYNKSLVNEVKADLLKAGIPAERVEKTIGNNLSRALQAYIAVASDGRVKIRTPDRMLADAAQTVRTKFNKPAPNRETAPAPSITPAPSRLDAKRNLVSQPNRASVPLTTAAPKNGQSPQARSSVVAKMRAARGQ
jgi:hypothetical protein